MNRRVARYVRVSRSEQNPDLQLDETARVVAARGWQLVDTYTDHGVSGSRNRRPELDRMLADARRGLFDTLLVWRSDRLFRSLRHMVLTIEELAAMHIDFVSVTEPFDTTTPQGRLLLHMVSAFGKFERQVLVERTKAGLDAARRRGKRIGRPKAFVDVPPALVNSSEELRRPLQAAVGRHEDRDRRGPREAAIECRGNRRRSQKLQACRIGNLERSWGGRDV
jgi:DNA invertase Pin-like site-specific DNA recombinase